MASMGRSHLQDELVWMLAFEADRTGTPPGITELNQRDAAAMTAWGWVEHVQDNRYRLTEKGRREAKALEGRS